MDRANLEPFSIRITKGLKTELKIYCANNSLVMQEFVEEAIREKLKKEKK